MGEPVWEESEDARYVRKLLEAKQREWDAGDPADRFLEDMGWENKDVSVVLQAVAVVMGLGSSTDLTVGQLRKVRQWYGTNFRTLVALYRFFLPLRANPGAGPTTTENAFASHVLTYIQWLRDFASLQKSARNGRVAVATFVKWRDRFRQYCMLNLEHVSGSATMNAAVSY